jgi:predicted TIM-barrel enzyme
MHTLTLTGRHASAPGLAGRIYCPSLEGLSASQVDLAFVMPRIDHNRAVRETVLQGDWAAVLASDPFGSEAALFQQLLETGYRGITNWPSSILLDGTLRQSMSTIPASPEFEFAFLARARTAGLESLAFFLSLEQARTALEAGLDGLVLHPGILQTDNAEAGDLIKVSLQRIVDTIKAEAPHSKVFAYTSEWHEQHVQLSELRVDGLVRYEAGP